MTMSLLSPRCVVRHAAIRHAVSRHAAAPCRRRALLLCVGYASVPPARAKPPSSPPPTPAHPAAASGASPSLRQALGPVASVVGAYGRSQRRRPWLTQMASALVVFLCGDLAAQHLGGRECDVARTARALVIGFAAVVPLHKWFVFLSGSFNYPSRSLSLVAKVAVHQLFFTPAFNVYFFGAHALLAGQGLDAALSRVLDALPSSWLNSFKVWPATVFVSLAFLPLEYRALFSNLVAIGWQTYLSFLDRRAELRDETRASPQFYCVE